MTIPPDDLSAWVADFKRRYGLADLLLAADDHLLAERMDLAAEHVAANVPFKFRHAVPTSPEVQTWAAEVIRTAVTESQKHGRIATVHEGRSLLLLGGTGTGKTTETYGAMRVISACGLHSQWVVISAADFYARLRPRHGVDSEAEFDRVANAPLLAVDDLGAANVSPWVEEVNFRLVNRRYERMNPTIFTSNLPSKDTGDGRPGLASLLGDRVASRLREMALRVPLKGTDRRRAA